MLAVRQWTKMAGLAASGKLAEGPLFLLDYLLRALRVLVLVSIWRVLLETNPAASPLPLSTLLQYTLVAEIFAHAIGIRTNLAEAFWQGDLVRHFVRPMGVVRQFAADASGRIALDFVFFSIPLAIASPWLGVSIWPADLATAGLFAVSLGLAVCVGLAIEFFFGAVTLIADQPVWLVEWIRRAITAIVSGRLIPLALLPWGLGEIFAWLPFASSAWAPLAIYTDAEAAAPLLLRQLLWIALLWPLTLWLWASHRERVVAYGG